MSAYLTFVGLDEHNRPAPVPPVAPHTEAEKRRYQAAEVRRGARLATLEDVRAL